MSQVRRSKRLQFRMTRGSFRVLLVVWTAWTVLQLAIVVLRFATLREWSIGDYAFLAGLLLGIVSLIYLLHVRHHDGHFWDEEAAEQDDWERRGRALLALWRAPLL
ncbi:hypothetical protein ACFUCV_12475 [Specibacter sp. NPDC057265]|uniref:hypothetical protein n=1 Tax=Specibacter sp. NPDC057265 TaxID=3346075 RepID=UPI003625ABA9